MPCHRTVKKPAPCRPSRIAPWRRTVQWGGVLLLLTVPFLRPGGVGLLRFDLPRQRLELFGSLLLLDELSLLLLAILALTVFFLLVTLVLGRLWCGWLCPQTILSEIVEAVARRLGLETEGGRIRGPALNRSALHGFSLALSLLVATNVVWFFLPPQEFFSRLVQGELGSATLLALGSVATIVYLDITLVRRVLCREFCPYGRFQAALIDGATLTLQFANDRKDECLGCNACVRACPTEIDIRDGLQVECIACGRCLDACRKVQSACSRPGLIRYRFGEKGRGPAALLNPRTVLLGVVMLGLCAALVAGMLQRSTPHFILSPSVAPPRHLADGRMAVFYSAQLGNRTSETLTLELHAAGARGGSVELRGPASRLELKGYERRRLDFALIMDQPPGAPEAIVFTLEDIHGRRLKEVQIIPMPVEVSSHEP